MKQIKKVEFDKKGNITYLELNDVRFNFDKFNRELIIEADKQWYPHCWLET